MPRWKRRQCIFLFLSVCGVYLCTLTDVDFYRIVDGQIMFDTAVSLHEFGELGISAGPDKLAERSVGDDHYGIAGLGLSVVQQLPLLFVNVFEKSFGQASSNLLFALTNLLLTALTALFVALCIRELGLRFRSAVLAAIGFALGTFTWPYISYDFSEPLQEFCLTAAFWLILRTVRSESRKAFMVALAGILLGFTVLTKASLLVLLPSFAFYLWSCLTADERRRLIPWFVLPILLFGLTIAILNLHRFGSMFDFGYGRGGAWFTNPMMTGLYGLLIGPNKGLIFYAPLALLIPWSMVKMKGSHRREIFFFLSVFAIHTLLTSKWWSWEGGESWGPRMLLPIIPMVVICAALFLDTARAAVPAFVTCVILGIGINLLGLFLYFPVWPVLVKLNNLRLPLNAPARLDTESVEQDGKKWFRPSIGTYYLPALSPIRGHAWVLRLRYLDVPFSMRALDENATALAPTVNYPPITIHFALLKDHIFLSYLRSPHFWLWDKLRSRPQEEIFSYPAYGMALEHQGDRALGQNNVPRAFSCYRRASELMPNNASPSLKLARLQFQQGLTHDAELTLKNYLTYLSKTESHGDDEFRRPQRRAAHVSLAQLYEAVGNREAALQEYRFFLSLQPSEQEQALVQSRIEEIIAGAKSNE